MPSATKAAAKVRTALLVRLQAKPGKEAAVAKFLEGGLPIVEQGYNHVVCYQARTVDLRDLRHLSRRCGPPSAPWRQSRGCAHGSSAGAIGERPIH